MSVQPRQRNWADVGGRTVLAAALSLIGGAAVQAQAPAAGGDAAHVMQKAAGMALRDGALAPGMLTVRVVRGSFDRNAANETVQLDVGGRIERAVTGPDGRAQFAHLPIGSSVQATAIVDGQALVSERFNVAADSGSRVLLIAGEGDATASGVPSEPVSAAPETAAAAQAGSAPADGATVVGIRVAFAMATTVALGLVVFGKYRWRPGRSSRRPDA